MHRHALDISSHTYTYVFIDISTFIHTPICTSSYNINQYIHIHAHACNFTSRHIKASAKRFRPRRIPYEINSPRTRFRPPPPAADQGCVGNRKSVPPPPPNRRFYRRGAQSPAEVVGISFVAFWLQENQRVDG
jgi:hypothetical protein